MPPKRIAFLVFLRLTMLDFIGAYDALRRVAAMSIDKEVTHRVIGTTCSTSRAVSAPSR
jgi:hypothetical protein